MPCKRPNAPSHPSVSQGTKGFAMSENLCPGAPESPRSDAAFTTRTRGAAGRLGVAIWWEMRIRCVFGALPLLLRNRLS